MTERRIDLEPPIRITAEQIGTLAQDEQGVVIYAHLTADGSLDSAILIGAYDLADEGSAAWLEIDGSYTTGE